MWDASVLFVSSGADSQLYLDALSDRRWTVIHAGSPEAALQILMTDIPDVVVTELAFAETVIDGTALICELRARVDDATSIVVLSRYVRVDDRHQARVAGADLFLMKPALPSALVFEVQRALILRRGGRRLSWNWPGRVASATLPGIVERRQPNRAHP